MMPELVQELAAGRSVAVARLFQFEFLSSTRRFWDGLREFNAGGQVWEGSADVISVSGLEYAENMSATQVTFSMSGTTPELIAAALTSETEVTGRPCSVFLQFLAGRSVPLDNPIAIWSGTMDTLSFSGDVRSQSLTMTAETLFQERIRSPYGYMTDSDHQERWPGDKGMQFMPLLRNKTVTWLRS